MAPRRFSRLMLYASLLSLAVVWILAFSLWPSLPERFPVHFNAQGVPDRSAARGARSWFPLAVLPTVMTAMMLGIGSAVMSVSLRHPEKVNIPSKERFLNLDPEARIRVLEPLRALLNGMPLVVNLIFFYVLWGTHSVATGALRMLPLWPVPILIASELAFTAGSIWGIQRAIHRETSAGQ